MSNLYFFWPHRTDLHFGLAGPKNFWPNLRKLFFDDLAKLYSQTDLWDGIFFTRNFV